MEADPHCVFGPAEDVYPPSEDTFLLLRAIEIHADERVLELGTGSGYIAVHAAKTTDVVVATDASRVAIRSAQENARANDVHLGFVRCDLFRGIRGQFNVIAFNPPYLAERIGRSWAERAWQGGPEGDELIMRFLRDARDHLAPHGRIYLVIPGNRRRALDWAEEHYDVRIAGTKPLFFESLLVVELSHPR